MALADFAQRARTFLTEPTFANQAGMTPQDVERRKALAEALIGQSMSGQPVVSVADGLSRISDAIFGGLINRKAEGTAAAQQQAGYDALRGVAGQIGGPMQPIIEQLLGNPATADMAQQILGAQIGQMMTPQGSGATDDITEYEFARANGFTGSFEDWMAIGHQPTVVNNLGPTGIDYGEAPTNYAWQRDDQGNVALDDRGAPIALPVGPALAEQQAAEAAAAAREQTRTNQGDIVLDNINRALDLSEQAFTTGFTGNIAAAIPGTPAYDLNQLVLTIGTNISLDRLQQMRDQSPTGGAVGQVTEGEWDRFAASLGSLSQSQSKEQFQYNLLMVERQYLDIVHGEGNWMMDANNSVFVLTPDQPQGQIPTIGTADQWGQLPQGWQYYDPDGQLRTKQ